MKYMEKWAGRDSSRPTPFTRIPAECLRDFTVKGCLSCILQCCFEYRRRHSLPKLDLTDDSNVEMHNEMFNEVIELLKRKGFLSQKFIFFHRDVGTQKTAQLKQIAEKHGAKIVHAPQNATHIILPDTYEMEESNEDFLRTLHVDREREVAYVHWWYYPSSYDEWVPVHMVQGESEPERPRTGAWSVGSRWLRDLNKFNEWMPELDYEIETGGTGTEPSSISQKAASFDFDEEVDESKKRIATTAGRKRTREDTMESQPKKRPKNTRRRGASTRSGRSEQYNAFSDMATPTARTTQETYIGPPTVDVTKPLYPVVVPAHANWFNQGMIHKIEWEEFKDTLQGATPKMTEMYVRVRDTIINTFRLNPRIYLTSTACRRLVTCDAGLAFRIHQFLERWNLINYYVDPGTIPQIEVENIQPTHYEDTSAVKKITVRPQQGSEAFLMQVESPNSAEQNQNFSTDSTEMEIEKTCHMCHEPLTESVYRSKAIHNLIICPKCYSSDRLSGCQLSDFDHDFQETIIKEESTNKKKSAKEEEKERLIEACTIYQDDWERVATHCGKSIEDCIALFVSLPLDDPYIQHHSFLPSHEISTLADGSNPIMRQAAFLSSLVPPDLAAVASKTAIQYQKRKLDEENKKQILIPASEETEKTQSFNIGDEVNTKYGAGKLIQKNPENYTVQLAYGTGYLTENDIEKEQVPVQEKDQGYSVWHQEQDEIKKERKLTNLMKGLVDKELEKCSKKVDLLERQWDLLHQERHELQLCRHAVLKQRIELTQHLLQAKKILQAKRQAGDIVG